MSSRTSATINPKRLVNLSYLLLLFVCIVGFSILSDRQRADIEDLGSSDLYKQAGVLISFIVVITVFLRKGLSNASKVVDPYILAALLWIAATVMWSGVPSVSARRVVLTTLVVLTVVMVVDIIGSKQALKILAAALLSAIAASILVGLLIPGGKHLPSDPQSSIVGAWRGIFDHKNNTGLISALAVILCYYQYKIGGKKVWLFGTILSAILLYLSMSKTSMALLVPSMLFATVIVSIKNNKLNVYIMYGLLLILFPLTVYFGIDGLLAVLDDPQALTGRPQIWLGLFEMAMRNPFLGMGYGSIFGVGYDSELMNYAGGWVLTVAHGHNGYLEQFAAIGAVGLVLSVYAFILRPFHKAIFLPSEMNALSWMAIAVILFFSFHNLLETSLFDRTRAAWVVLLVVISSVRYELLAHRTGR